MKKATVRCDFISWDWQEQPDFKAVEASANWMLSHGATRIHFAMADTGTDDNCLVVSDSHLSNGAATHAYEDYLGTLSPDDPQPAEWAPFVWRRR